MKNGNRSGGSWNNSGDTKRNARPAPPQRQSASWQSQPMANVSKPPPPPPYSMIHAPSSTSMPSLAAAQSSLSPRPPPPPPPLPPPPPHHKVDPILSVLQPAKIYRRYHDTLKRDLRTIQSVVSAKKRKGCTSTSQDSVLQLRDILVCRHLTKRELFHKIQRLRVGGPISDTTDHSRGGDGSNLFSSQQAREEQLSLQISSVDELLSSMLNVDNDICGGDNKTGSPILRYSPTLSSSPVLSVEYDDEDDDNERVLSNDNGNDGDSCADDLYGDLAGTVDDDDNDAESEGENRVGKSNYDMNGVSGIESVPCSNGQPPVVAPEPEVGRSSNSNTRLYEETTKDGGGKEEHFILTPIPLRDDVAYVIQDFALARQLTVSRGLKGQGFAAVFLSSLSLIKKENSDKQPSS